MSVYVNPTTGAIRTKPRRKERFPEWATPERRYHLAKLRLALMGVCLQGHRWCDFRVYPDHFIHHKPKATWRATPKAMGWLDTKTGLMRKDKFYPGWAPQRVLEYTPELSNSYFRLEADLIEGWKDQDRAEREALLQIERAQIHGEKGVFGSTFDPVARDVFMANRPEYYLRGTGVSVFGTVRPVALVRVPSTNIGLFVDVAGAKALSKNKRRKMRRYGQEAPAGDVDQLCRQAVAHWWSK